MRCYLGMKNIFVPKYPPSLNATVDMSNFYNVIRDFFINFGIDIDEYNITYDIFPQKNKSEWGGYNFPIETRKDSRILANVKINIMNMGYYYMKQAMVFTLFFKIQKK